MMYTKRLTRDEWIEKYEVEDNVICIVAGCNTYEIKDRLKELGAKFFSGINWFFTKKTLPDEETFKALAPDIFYYVVTVEELFNPEGYYFNGILDEIREIITKKEKEINKAKFGASQHVGEVGQRLRGMNGILLSARYFNNDWGGSFVYTFKVGDDIFTWFTQKVLEFEINDEVELTGTVKAHTEYNGIMQTQLTRCIVK